MEKINLSSLLEFGKKEYNNTKLDEKIKQRILEKTIYKKSIFSNIFKYTSASIVAVLAIFLIYNQLNFETTNNLKKTEGNNIKKEKVFYTENTNLDSSADMEDSSVEFGMQSNRTIGIAGAGLEEENINYNLLFIGGGGGVILILIVILIVYFRRKKK